VQEEERTRFKNIVSELKQEDFGFIIEQQAKAVQKKNEERY
jgi:Ribonuclease G/E